MADLRYIDISGRERTIPTEHVTSVETGTGDSAVVLRDDHGSRYPLDRTQAIMIARQAWQHHKNAVKSCDHCYWHDARSEREDCPALCCRMREAAAAVGIELQAYARASVEEPKEDPFRLWLSSWLARNTIFVGVCMALKIPLPMYLTSLLTVTCALILRRLYYYYMGARADAIASEEVI